MVLRLAWGSLLAAVLIARSAAHSWVDCIDHSYDVVYTNSDRWALTGTKGNGVCEGYAYGFPGRGVSTIGTDFTHKLLPDDIKRDAPVCQYKAKDADYTGWRKAIVAKPGDKLYFAYFSNGHVVRDKAGPGTTHGVYWDGRPDVELEKPSQLTKDKLVDKIQDFDDGNCGETYSDGNYAGGTILSGRAGDFKPCVGTFTIPSGTKSGTYPMVWYWTFFKPEDFAANFHTFEGAGGAAYSSCFNVIVEAGEGGASTDKDDAKSDSKVVEPKVEVQSPTVIKVDGVKQPIVNPQSGHSNMTADIVTDKKPTAPSDNGAAKPQTASNGTNANATQPAVIPAADAGHPTVVQTPANAKPAKDVKCRVDADATVPPPPTADALSDVTAPDAMTEPQMPSVSEPQTPAPVATTTASAPVPITGTTYIGVGGKGTYGKVTGMLCPDNRPSSDHCVQTPVNVNGPLAPFDEDLTLALRGPLEIDDIAVFTKSDGPQDAPWTKVSSYSHKQANATQNMVFLNNKGDPAKSGEFSMCHGNSQSFSSGDGKTAAPAACAFNGKLEDGVEVNVMSSTTCPTSGKSGFARGVAYEGWSGNHKIFMVKAQMPHAGGKDLPAIWLLNGQVVRTAEYGCNCRGMGDTGPFKGGCGELDVAEIISENKDKLVSQIYSFKGSKGTSPTMARPSDERVVFVVIFSTSSGASHESAAKLGTVQILMLRADDVDMNTPPTAQCVKEWLAYRDGKLVDFDI